MTAAVGLLFYVLIAIRRAIEVENFEHIKFYERPENQKRIGPWSNYKERAICQADIICVTLTSSRNVVHKELEKIYVT